MKEPQQQRDVQESEGWEVMPGGSIDLLQRCAAVMHHASDVVDSPPTRDALRMLERIICKHLRQIVLPENPK